MHFLAFAGAAFLIAMTPGVSSVVIVRETLRGGRRAGLAATLGNETGVLAWALAAAFGLTALLAASQLAYDVLRVGGALVLLAMGAQALWQARRPGVAPLGAAGAAEGPPEGRVRAGRAYLHGLATIAANPKAAVFALSFLPQFVPAGADVPLTLAAFALIWVAVDTLWYGAVVWFAGGARHLLSRPSVKRRLEQVSGAVLVAFGVRLITETR
ncbi:LysE family translocator [Bailinhaonella thermotolerans]|uniref:LysE family translocator n=1 Tax=Bailinhaonella thermotolerans TaxID=1070861 RepID=A0A3A4BB87_9ACTN|nr:LysE family translocator [Bailinhaonella thermotolerans]RJL35346.1 LysE family translocator [Bailinhaonella thermotolerans]